MKKLLLAVLIVAPLLGCAEGGSGSPAFQGAGGAAASSTSTATSTSTSTATTGTGEAGGTSASTGAGGEAPHVGAIVINEISASGDDWVELTNPTPYPLVLAGFSIADADSDGNPDLDHATKLGDGVVLEAFAHLVILGGEDDDGGGKLQTDCLKHDGPLTCLWATWKISSSDGDALYVVDPDGAIVSHVDFPADAVPDGQTWGRLPDATGEFAPDKPTPGGSNEAI